MVAGLEGGDGGADRLDYAGRFMAEHCRSFRWQSAMKAVQVAMADTAGDGSDQDLVRTRLVDFNFFNCQWLF